MAEEQNLVTITIDEVTVKVPKGTNLIEAARIAGIDIPYYCYHPHLSIAGNCRMCQVEIQGQPKLAIGCNTVATEGMVVKTQHSSNSVSNAQRATLEFLLINHPLDCTVCDQAGHCKLQDYYYEYNKSASRFVEDKVHKVKAEPLGSEVIYDGERCIVCTRCVRFCDEVTKTSELTVLNRGDKSVIAISPGNELENPFSGSVVDLCPVGALTHRRWRFNSRIWYADERETICTGCSTGCNVKVAVRDDKIVHVKARLNSHVNQEWLCDEGRYGFERFQPESRLLSPLKRSGEELKEWQWDDALKFAVESLQGNSDSDAAVIISPFLTLEEMWVTVEFAAKVMGVSLTSESLAVQTVSRQLTELQSILISPDYTPNARAAEVLGIVSSEGDFREKLQKRYFSVLEKIKSGLARRILFVGDFSVRSEDVDDRLASVLLKAEASVFLTSQGVITDVDSDTPLGVHQLCSLILPTRSVHEKNGLMVNKNLRIQKLCSLISPPFGTLPEWMVLSKMADKVKRTLFPSNVTDERALFHEMVKRLEVLRGLELSSVGNEGIDYFKKV